MVGGAVGGAVGELVLKWGVVLGDGEVFAGKSLTRAQNPTYLVFRDLPFYQNRLMNWRVKKGIWSTDIASFIAEAL